MIRYVRLSDCIDLKFALRLTLRIVIGVWVSWSYARGQLQQLTNVTPKVCGDTVDIYKSVESKWNAGASTNPCHVVSTNSSGEGPDGFEYQCVEFIRRFYRLAKGCDTSNPTCNTAQWAGKGNAADYYGLAASFGLEAHKNGADTSMPQPDDILSYSGGSVCSKGPPVKYCGHVNIIKNIAQISPTSWNVYVIEQNVKPSATQEPLLLTQNVDGTYTLNDLRFRTTTLAVQGWLRPPTAVRVTATLDGQPYVGPVQFTLSVPPSASGVVSIFGQAIPYINSNMPVGSYEVFNVIGGPPNSTLIGISPCAGPLLTDCTAPLVPEQTLHFVLQFTSNPPTNIVYSQLSYDPSLHNGPPCGLCGDFIHDWDEPTGNPPGKLASLTLKLWVQSDSEFQAGCVNCGTPGDFGAITIYSIPRGIGCYSTNSPMLASFARDTWQDFTFTFDPVGCSIDFSKGDQIWDIQRAGNPPYGWSLAFTDNGQIYAIIRAQ